jgi:hypothetical protein
MSPIRGLASTIENARVFEGMRLCGQRLLQSADLAHAKCGRLVHTRAGLSDERIKKAQSLEVRMRSCGGVLLVPPDDYVATENAQGVYKSYGFVITI